MPMGVAAAALVAVFALSANPARAANEGQPATLTTDQAAKKVWTNDDLRALESTPLSFESEAVAAARNATAPGAPQAPAKGMLPKQLDPAWYRVQLASLHAQLAEIEAKQHEIRAALDGHRSGTNALNMVEDSEGIRPQSELQILEERRTAILAKIDALEDQAHRNGIAPGELRREASAADYAVIRYMNYALATAPPPGPPHTEQEWRARFAELRRKLDFAKRELNVLQQELGIAWVQYYPDPLKTIKEEYTFREINQLRARIAEKKVEITSLEQQISDLEDDLRHAGLPAGWSRE
jgi:multidrug resistance efflux pump